MSPAYNQYREDVGENGAYGLSSLAKILERLTICRCCIKGSTFSSFIFKTLIVVVVWGLNPQLPTQP